MLIGEYIHTIDEKNRVSMPAVSQGASAENYYYTGLGAVLVHFTPKNGKVSHKLSSSDSIYLSQSRPEKFQPLYVRASGGSGDRFYR